MLFYTLLIIFLGVLYGVLFHTGKKYLLQKQSLTLELLFTGVRISILIAIFFYIIKFIEINPILLLTLFVSSYLSTIAILTYKN